MEYKDFYVALFFFEGNGGVKTRLELGGNEKIEESEFLWWKIAHIAKLKAQKCRAADLEKNGGDENYIDGLSFNDI